MFSGGILSKNLGQSFGKIKRKRRALKKKQGSELKKGFCNDTELNICNMILNWSEGAVNLKNNPNATPIYAIRVEGKIQFKSYATCLSTAGSIVLLIGFLTTILTQERLYGPIGIGTGLYTAMMGVCWLLDDRDHNSKLIHVQDLYLRCAVKKYETHGKSMPGNKKLLQSTMKKNPQDPLLPFTKTFSENSNFSRRNSSSTFSENQFGSFGANYSEVEDEAKSSRSDSFDSFESPATPSTSRRSDPKIIRRSSMRKLTYDVELDHDDPVFRVTSC